MRAFSNTFTFLWSLFFASWLSAAVCAWLRGWENLLLARFPGALTLGVPEVFTVADASDTSDLWRLFEIELDFSLWMITPTSVNTWCNLSVCVSLKLIYKYSSGPCLFFFLLMSVPWAHFYIKRTLESWVFKTHFCIRHRFVSHFGGILVVSEILLYE